MKNKNDTKYSNGIFSTSQYKVRPTFMEDAHDVFFVYINMVGETTRPGKHTKSDIENGS